MRGQGYTLGTMRIYLDMCCLKRPFDDQSQPRIHIETEAVLTLLKLEKGGLELVRAAPLLIENAWNRVPERAARIGQWLREGAIHTIGTSPDVEARASELTKIGLKNLDALYVATAEDARADRFVTVDDRLLATLRRNSGSLRVKACSLVECVEEVSK